MKRGTFTGILALAVAAGFSFGAHAELKDNPYQVIVERNPFGLKPIPPPEPAKKEEAPVEPPPDIKLTGITTLLGTPKVFLQLEDKKTKKPSFPPPMAENDTDPSGITVLQIDTENMKVRIRNGDAETTLDFKNNGVKAAAVASAAPVPHPGGVVPLNPVGVPGVPTAPPAVPGQASAATSARGAIVAGGAATTPVAGNPAAYPNAAIGTAPYGGLPQRPLRTDNNLSIVAGGGGQVYNPNPTPQYNPQPTMSKEEAEARIEATKRILMQQQQAGQAIPHSPSILPPTSIGRAADSVVTPNPNLPR